MTTVEALPPETLEHIISFLGAPHGCRHLPYIKPSTGEDERRDLCAAALVGRSWRRPSQRVLWEEIRIFSKETLRLFVEATLATGYRTRYLFVGGHEYWVGVGGAGRLIQGCIGLRRLRIVDCKNVVAVLRLPELQGIKELYVENHPDQLGIDNDTAVVPPFDFVLTHLRFSGGGRFPSMISYLRALLQPTLTTLSLTHHASAHELGLLSLVAPSLAVIAPNLTTLELHGIEIDAPSLPFLSLCTSLVHFLSDKPSFLIPIPSTTLSRFTYSANPSRESLAHVLAALRAGTPGVAHLRVLDWANLKWAKAYPRCAWKELVEECRKREIAFVYAPEE